MAKKTTLLQGEFKMPNGRAIKFEIEKGGCFICKSHLDSKGYPRFKKNGKYQAVSRAIYEMYNGPMPEGKYLIRHSCDNPACINPHHLAPGTQADNIADRVRRNRSAIGENHGRAKLNNKKVRHIKDHPEIGIKKFAEIYGVDKMVISRIRNGKYWKHI